MAEDELTLRQAAERAGISVSALRHAMRAGRLTTRRVETLVGSYHVVTDAELTRYLEGRWGGKPRRPGGPRHPVPPTTDQEAT